MPRRAVDGKLIYYSVTKYSGPNKAHKGDMK